MSAYTFSDTEADTLKQVAERYAKNEAQMDEDTKNAIDKVMKDASALDLDNLERLGLKSLIDITLAIEEAGAEGMDFDKDNLQNIAKKLETA